MSIRRLIAVSQKEVAHILRDRGTLFLVLVTPSLVLIIMAYALTVDIAHVPVVVLDRDRTPASRTLIQQLFAGEDLELYAQVESLEQIEELLVRGETKAAVIVDTGFSEKLLSLRGLALQIIVDGTEPQSGGFAVEHIGARAEQYIARLLADRLSGLGLTAETLNPIDLRVRAWYNPSLKPRVDIVPGLISMVLAFPSLSVALTFAHEREHGTLEQLMVSPIGRSELLLGKIVPYLLIGQANAIIIPALAIIWFQVPFNGNFALFFGLTAVFMFAVLSMGVLVGVFIRTQAAALALSFLVIFFPGFFLTGIFFPLASMPEIARLESMVLPGTHYAIITRGVFLPAVGIEVLWPFGLMLLVLGVAFTGVAALFFRKRIE